MPFVTTRLPEKDSEIDAEIDVKIKDSILKGIWRDN
jgi:hypothetical protein